jgi:hypothetical protein
MSLSFLAALAELTGGDAPISLFMGDLPSRRLRQNGVSSHRLEDALVQSITEEQASQLDIRVYDILRNGRRRETDFDVRHSPLAAYFYAHLGDAGLERVLTTIQVYPMSPTTAMRLLNALPQLALTYVATNIAELAPSRKDLIHAILDSLDGSEKGDGKDDVMS